MVAMRHQSPSYLTPAWKRLLAISHGGSLPADDGATMTWDRWRQGFLAARGGRDFTKLDFAAVALMGLGVVLGLVGVFGLAQPGFVL